jgi:hypothetical protein
MSIARRILIPCLIAAAAISRASSAAGANPLPVLPQSCDRACLYGFVDRYLDALGHNDARQLPWAAHARYSENNVALPPGDGMWATTTKVDAYRLKFADVQAGEVGVFGIIEESNNRSGFALRLRISDNRISEAEALIVRIAEFSALDGGVNPFASAKFFSKPILESNLTDAQKRPRERLISVANGYFDTLQLNDGTLFTQFDPQCERYENGILTTNNPAKTLGPVTALGCEAQFKLGAYRFDDRVRGRRFPLVDEERGLVLATGFIDHTGRLGPFKLTDGSTEQSPLRRPHSFCLMELFKIVDGKIRQVEAVFITVPYNMPSPWVD